MGSTHLRGTLRTEVKSKTRSSGRTQQYQASRPSEIKSGAGGDGDHTQCVVHPEMQPATDDPNEPRRVVRENRKLSAGARVTAETHSPTGLLLPSFSRNG